MDTAVGEGQHAVSELLREAFWRLAGNDWLEKFQEFGGATGPVAALIEEVTDGLGQRGGLAEGRVRGRGSEGLLHFLLGATKGRTGGHGPGERVGASGGGRVHVWDAAEGGRDGGAEGGEDGRPSLVENRQEAIFGAGSGVRVGDGVRRVGRGGREGREGDGNGALGEVDGAGPAPGDGEQHGALVVLLERFGRGPGVLAEGSAEAGGEAAEGVGKLWGEGGQVIEGKNPIVAGQSEEVADGGRDGGEGRSAGIDDRAEYAGGEGLAGAGRALEDEDGERPVGVEGGKEPGEAAEPVGAGWEVEAGAEGLEGAGDWSRGGGFGKGDGGAGGLEESAGSGGSDPAGGRDFNKLAFWIGEVEENLGRQEAATAVSDATPNGEALVGAAGVVGLGFQVIEDSVEGAGARQGVVLGEEFMEEPLAIGLGADGEDVVTSVGGALRRTKVWPSEAVKGMPCRAMAMRGAKGSRICSY